MHEPTLLPAEPSARHRHAAIIAALVLAVAAMGFGGWALLAAAFEFSAPPSTVTSQSPARQPAAMATSTVRVSDRGLAFLSSFTFETASQEIRLAVREHSGDKEQGFAPTVRKMRLIFPHDPTRILPDKLSAGSSIDVPLPADATRFQLAYTVQGAVVGSEPSAAGRGLALLSVLDVSADTDIAFTLVAQRPEVTNLGCQIGNSPMVACGSQTSKGWRLRIDSADGERRVVAQVNLAQL
ncbi:MAG: hypothetical protein ACR2GB_00540 [Nocardioidaceae bacterium]